MANEKDLKVTDLLLDTSNYRTGKQTNQREAIQAIIDEQKHKLVKLAQDILDNGLSPLEKIMVMPVAGDARGIQSWKAIGESGLSNLS
jgi:hypothetical protein